MTQFDPALKVVFGKRIEALIGDSGFEGKGRSDSPSRRHFVKASRWEVVGDPDGLMRGSWLPTVEAKRMLGLGDFYADGTCLKLCTATKEVIVWVKGTKVYLDQKLTIECPLD